MKSEIIWTFCPDCKKRRKHEIKEELKRESGTWSESEENIYFQEDKVFQIIECCGCETVSYRQFIQTETGISSERIYPIIDGDHIDLKDFGQNTPDKIKNLYSEVIQTFNNKHGVLCAAGIRAVIEGICNEKNIEDGWVTELDKATKMPKLDGSGNPKKKKSKNLDGKIEGLAEKGFITKSYATTLHNLRFLGNQAVHQLDKPSEEHLKLAIDIIEHTLTSIYTIEIKAEKLKSQAKEQEIVELEQEEKDE